MVTIADPATPGQIEQRPDEPGALDIATAMLKTIEQQRAAEGQLIALYNEKKKLWSDGLRDLFTELNAATATTSTQIAISPESVRHRIELRKAQVDAAAFATSQVAGQLRDFQRAALQGRQIDLMAAQTALSKQAMDLQQQTAAAQHAVLERQEKVLQAQADALEHANKIQKHASKEQNDFLEKQAAAVAETNRIYRSMKWLTVVIAIGTGIQALYALGQMVK